MTQEEREETIDWEDRYLRLAADYDNFRKNKIVEIDNIRRMAKKDLMLDLLPVVDSIHLAEKSNENIPEGINNIFKMFLTVLSNNGLVSYGKEGDKFNENLYDAVSVVYDKDLEPGIIRDIVKSGYTLNDNIIRHAQVTVTN